jgi:Ca2+-binding RTX toxin-like protein
MATIIGKSADDTLNGTDKADDIAGLNGNDIIRGRLGNDQIDGGEGNDTIYGGPDNDTLIGGPGNDSLYGGTHADTLIGGIGNDKLYADQGYDTLDGGAGDDELYGGNDSVSMLGGTGNDTLVAGQGGSTMSGGEGDDTMTGAIGSDYFTSEKDDADTFIITDDDGNFGYDNISGFNGAGVEGGDVLRLEGIEKGTFTITEHYGFGGVVYFDKVVEGTNTATPAATDTAATLSLTDVAAPSAGMTETAGGTEADTKLASYTGLFGPPTSAYTTFTSDAGTIQVDAIGLEEGLDYVYDIA